MTFGHGLCLRPNRRIARLRRLLRNRQKPQKTTESAMTAILNLIDNIVSLYIWILFFAVIASWLINFNVINTSNRAVYMIVDVLYKLTEPALRPIRRLLPNLGGLDLSPMVLILLLWFIRDLIFDIAR